MKKFDFLPTLAKDFDKIYKATIFLMIAIGVVYIFFTIGQKKADFKNKIIGANEQISRIIGHDLNYIRYQINYAVKQINLNKANEVEIAKLLSTFVTNINNQMDLVITWNAFSWIDKNDNISVDGVEGVLSKKINVSSRDYLKETKINPEKLIFGDVIRGALSERLIIPVGVGIFSEDSEYLGTLVFGLDIEKIRNKISSSLRNESINFLALKDKKILFSSKNADDYSLEFINLLTKKLIKKNEKEKFKSSSTLEQGLIIGSTTPFSSLKSIEDYPLEILAFYNPEKSREEITRAFLEQFLFLTLVTLCCVLMLNLLNKRFFKPISDLSDYALKISQRDFSFTIEEPRKTEFVNLYNTLKSVKQLVEREEILISKLESANEKISKENFSKSEFLAAISHDIRNPLSAIISFSQLVQDEAGTGNKDEIKEWAKDIEHCATDIYQFINDLMDVDQISSGEFSVDLSKEINIEEIIRRSIRVNRDFARKRNIEISSNISQNITPIKLDARRMKQVLVNLISNSIKYSKEGSEIEIRAKKIVEESLSKLQIIVKDHGFGMTEEQLKIALTKYGKIENENSKKVDSFGLGLPLVKQLVEAQNGKMQIESTLGVGTKVIITFYC